MKLTVLTENCAGRDCLAEHGISFYIEHEGTRLLMDAGHSDVFLHNAESLGINLEQAVDIAVLSHGHWDHGNGFRFLNGKRLICHPLVFMPRFRRMDKTPIGLKMSKAEWYKFFEVETTIAPLEIEKGIIFLGEIPRKNDFESQSTPFIEADGTPDFVLDDSALVVVEGGALIIITGCSHSGICNIVDYAIHVTGITHVKAVLGGFHLKKDDTLTAKTIAYLKKLNVEKIFPSHCTEFEALTAFRRAFDFQQIKTGMTIEL